MSDADNGDFITGEGLGALTDLLLKQGIELNGAGPALFLERPWGGMCVFACAPEWWIKIIIVKSGHRLSLQKHEKRDEWFIKLQGKYNLWIGGRKVLVSGLGDAHLIRAGQEHRIEAIDNDAVVAEIAFGEPDEDDIIRIADDYGRDKVGR